MMVTGKITKKIIPYEEISRRYGTEFFSNRTLIHDNRMLNNPQDITYYVKHSVHSRPFTAINGIPPTSINTENMSVNEALQCD